jgi:hypothetical protein
MRDAEPWIATRSGLKFHPFNPSPDEICLEDIAGALSKICRYTGHAQRFYSVAEHSLRVLSYVTVACLDSNLSQRDQLGLMRHALLHDASEAYLCDLSAPIKGASQMTGYRVAEMHIEAAIAERFGLRWEMPPIVRVADQVLLASEWPDLMPRTPTPDGFPDPQPRFMDGPALSPREAESQFLERAWALGLS